jgi:hypothetical protein
LLVRISARPAAYLIFISVGAGLFSFGSSLLVGISARVRFGSTEDPAYRSASVSIRIYSGPLGASSLGLWPILAITSCRIKPSNSMLGLRPTTPQDYPEWSGFGGQREREWGHRRQRAAG